MQELWTREVVKMKGKAVLKANYWSAVLVAFLMSLMAGGYSVSTTTKQVQNQTLDPTSLGTYAAPEVTMMMLMGGVVFTLLSILLFQPLTVGCYQFFVACDKEEGNVGTILSGLKQGYGRNVLTMFLMQLKIVLWTLLFIIPGIVKAYEYSMVPYLISENPEMTQKEAFEKSKLLTTGYKWKLFVFDLSYIGWHLLSLVTCGILEIFYVMPYIHMAKAQIYIALRDGLLEGNQEM